MKILVTGGAGYIGSHVVRALLKAHHQIEVLDDLSRGHREWVPSGVPLHIQRLGDDDKTLRVLVQGGFDVVMHLAALSYVGESVRNPMRYYDVNLAQTLVLLRHMVQFGPRKLVFSSSCAAESMASPYGASKSMIENILIDLADAGEMNAVALRYFNAAGMGEDIPTVQHTELEPRAINAALTAAYQGTRFRLFGSSQTPDRTCIRDYVHVEDIARAHLLSLPCISGYQRFDVGSSDGYSVADILAAVRQVTGKPVCVEQFPARTGDPAIAVAGTCKLPGWFPGFTLTDIIRSADAWYRRQHGL